VAVGADGRDGAAWHSPDGVSWRRFDLGSTFTNATFMRVAAVHGRYVLFGFRDADPPHPPPVIIATGDPPRP
jgi:hypothetical protein